MMSHFAWENLINQWNHFCAQILDRTIICEANFNMTTDGFCGPSDDMNNAETSLQVCRLATFQLETQSSVADWSKRSHSVVFLSFVQLLIFQLWISILSSLLSALCSTAGASNRSENHSTVYHRNLPCINVALLSEIMNVPFTVQYSTCRLSAACSLSIYGPPCWAHDLVTWWIL